MRIWTVAGKNLLRRPTRSLFTVFGIGIAVAALIGLVGVAHSLENSLLDLYNQRGADFVVQPRGGAVQLSKGIKLSFRDRLQSVPGVRNVIGGLMDLVSFENQGIYLVILNGWEPDSIPLQKATILSGRRLQAGDQHKVMLGRILAANLGKTTGDHLKIYGQDFEVVSVFESFSIYENGAATMLLDELQRQMDRPGDVTGFLVESADKSPEGVAELRRRIEALDLKIAATPCADFVSNISQIKIARTMSWFTSTFALIIGALSVMNTMAMSIFERRSEIAALRAMGWHKWRVTQLILSESAILAAFGAIVGVASGILVTFGLAHWKRTSGLVQGNVSSHAICQGILVALAIALVGAAYPAYRCNRLPIADALRGA